MMKRSFLSLVSMAFIAAMTLTSCDEIMSAIDNPVDSYLQVDGPELYVAEGSSIEVACATISDGEVTFTVADAKVAKVEKVEPHMAKVTGLKVGETDVIVKLAATEYYKAAEAKVKIIVKPTYSLKDAVVDGAKLKIGYKLNNEDCEFVYEFDGEKKVFNLLPANSAVPQAMDAYDITMTYDENAETITHKVVSKENISDVPLVLNLYTGGSFDRVFRLANEMKSLQVNGYEILPYVPESYTPVAVITAGLLPDNMKVGDQGLYTISFTPDKTTNQVIVFSSTNPDIITIDEKGAFKAIAVGEATIKAVSAENPTKVCEQTITVDLPKATVTTAPTAKTGVKAGENATIINAGVTSDGTMMYALTTTNTKPTFTSLFGSKVPTAQNYAAGTYYVWYYVKADATHADSDIAGSVEVTIETALPSESFTTTCSSMTKGASFDGTHFTVTAPRNTDSDGINIANLYSNQSSLTIAAKNGETITKVEFTCGEGKDQASLTSVTSGTINWSNGQTNGSIENVNAHSVTMTNSYTAGWVAISSVKVYYTE